MKAVFFDFMGTCLDWCTSVTACLPSGLTEEERRTFALEWRVDYFRENEQRHKEGLPLEDIDDTLRRTLEKKLETSKHSYAFSKDRREYIEAWHRQKAWLDVDPAHQLLRESGLELFVLANGTTRLQLDLIRSSGLRFDLTMSSQMIGSLKPSKEHYLKGLELVKYKAEDVVMVAAHIMDLRGAKNAGLRTIYIHRSTDDIHEDLEGIEEEFDAVLDDMSQLHSTIVTLSNTPV